MTGFARTVGQVEESSKQPRVTQLVNPTQRPKEITEPKQTNYIAVVVDQSGSMGGLRTVVPRELEKFLQEVKRVAFDTKQDTRLLVSFFNSDYAGHFRARRTFNHAFDGHSFAFTSTAAFGYQPAGGTPLNDAVDDAAKHLYSLAEAQRIEARSKRLPPPDQSFLVLTITDGRENDSIRTSLKEVLDERAGDPRWSFAFMAPNQYSAERLIRDGVPAGNVTTWEASEEGTRVAFATASQSYQGYSAERAKGATRTTSFFPDLSKLTTSQVREQLQNVSIDYERIPVHREQEIKTLIEEETGRPYRVGDAFYELTKPEAIQGHKEILLIERWINVIYGGERARALIGLPPVGPGTVTRVRPGNHANYRIFVQSTSVNRKLVRGTTVLYRRK